MSPAELGIELFERSGFPGSDFVEALFDGVAFAVFIN